MPTGAVATSQATERGDRAVGQLRRKVADPNLSSLLNRLDPGKVILLQDRNLDPRETFPEQGEIKRAKIEGQIRPTFAIRNSPR